MSLHRNPPTWGSEKGVRAQRLGPRKTTTHNNPAHPPKRKPSTAQRTRTTVGEFFLFSPSICNIAFEIEKSFFRSFQSLPEIQLNIQQKTTLSYRRYLVVVIFIISHEIYILFSFYFHFFNYVFVFGFCFLFCFVFFIIFCRKVYIYILAIIFNNASSNIVQWHLFSK